MTKYICSMLLLLNSIYVLGQGVLECTFTNSSNKVHRKLKELSNSSVTKKVSLFDSAVYADTLNLIRLYSTSEKQANRNLIRLFKEDKTALHSIDYQATPINKVDEGEYIIFKVNQSDSLIYITAETNFASANHIINNNEAKSKIDGIVYSQYQYYNGKKNVLKVDPIIFSCKVIK